VNRARVVRLAFALAALVVTAFLADSAFATGSSEKDLTTVNRQVLADVNAYRVAHGLVPLRESPGLDRSARQHSEEMGRRGYFHHASADGTVFWRRIERYYPEKGHSYWSVGENLVFESPRLSARRAMQRWIGSPPHRANLLRPIWRQIGISAVAVTHAPGIYGGRNVVIITTDFGVRR
jgi:uncharacterized protein YkwD